MKLELERRTLALARPLQTAFGEITERELVLVALTGSDGATGYGEAAPLGDYDGPAGAQVYEALERYARVLAEPGVEKLGGAQLVDACRRERDLPAAFAAIDLALWDRAGRRSGQPVAALLTDAPATQVQVNATVSALDRSGVAEQAGVAARAALGPEVALRLDANGAWSVAEAVRTIEALAPAGLELVEEPVHGLRQMREVRDRVTVRVAIDESAGEPGALGAGVADAVCLKISRCGGIAGLLVAASLVRASGAEVYLASTLDGPLGVAAALHAAAALHSRGPLPPCGLATLGLFADIADQLPVRSGRIALPRTGGLGVDPL